MSKKANKTRIKVVSCLRCGKRQLIETNRKITKKLGFCFYCKAKTWLKILGYIRIKNYGNKPHFFIHWQNMAITRIEAQTKPQIQNPELIIVH